MLSQRDRQEYIHSHLKELAFPILKSGTNEMAADNIAPEIQWRPAVLNQILIVYVEASRYLPSDEQES
ncbi:hypothetical protein D9M71_820920 [compost metagenome]